MSPGELIRDARRSAGLTQKALALRTGTTQSAIARLENDRTNPTVETLEAMLHATGHDLALAAEPRESSGLDDSQIVEHLRLTPLQRLSSHDAGRRDINSMLRKARHVAPAAT